MKPGMSMTGRSPPSGTPSPRHTGLRRSAAASSPTRDSRQSGVSEGTGIPMAAATSHQTVQSVCADSALGCRAAMRAAIVENGQIAAGERPDPAPQAGELLVRVRAAGLNGADMLQVAGRYPAPPGAPPDVPGLELAGEVVECGDGVHRFEPGDRVMAVVAGGGQAELAVVHERMAMPVPEELDWPAAGGVPEVFTTAHDALFSQAELSVGERLLVHGAAGGVGMAAVQLGTMAGARVTATVRDPRCRERIFALGVQAIDPDGFEEYGPFDVVLELVGAPNMPGNLRALAERGRIAVIGVQAGTRAEVELHLLMGKRGRIHGSTLRSRSLED